MKRTKRETACLTVAIILFFAIMVCSVSVGSFSLSFAEIRDILFGNSPSAVATKVLSYLRVPRVLTGALAGLALGIAGAVYQIIFRNPLASPDLTGTAMAAAFGAACAIVFTAGSMAQIMTGAFVAGIASVVLLLLIVKLARTERMMTYILAGIIISAIAEAGIMTLKYLADPEKELAAIDFWTMGSLAAVTRPKLLATIGGIVIPLVLLLVFRKQVVLLSVGAENALLMGLDVVKWRKILLVLTTLMVSSVVAVTGVIVFIGLIAPHIAFLCLRQRTGSYMLLSGLTGGVLVLLADMGARTIVPGAEMPLSVLTIFFAVPVLFILFLRSKAVKGDA